MCGYEGLAVGVLGMGDVLGRLLHPREHLRRGLTGRACCLSLGRERRVKGSRQQASWIQAENEGQALE
jgi:hypothetical protein